jgi:hypothetical protein
MGYSVSSPGLGPATGAGGSSFASAPGPRARRRGSGRNPLAGGRRARGRRPPLARAARRPRVPRGAPARLRPRVSTARCVRELELLLRWRRYAGLLTRPSCPAGRLISKCHFVVQLDQFIPRLTTCIMFGSFFSKVTIGFLARRSFFVCDLCGGAAIPGLVSDRCRPP